MGDKELYWYMIDTLYAQREYNDLELLQKEYAEVLKSDAISLLIP